MKLEDHYISFHILFVRFLVLCCGIFLMLNMCIGNKKQCQFLSEMLQISSLYFLLSRLWLRILLQFLLWWRSQITTMSQGASSLFIMLVILCFSLLFNTWPTGRVGCEQTIRSVYFDSSKQKAIAGSAAGYQVSCSCSGRKWKCRHQ